MTTTTNPPRTRSDAPGCDGALPVDSAAADGTHLDHEPTRLAGHWDGGRLDLHYAVSVFATNRRLRDVRAACQPARAA